MPTLENSSQRMFKICFAFSTVACPVGTFNYIPRVVNKQESSSCTPCPQGMYQDEEGQQKCKPCDEGKTTQSLGASLHQDCGVDKDTSNNTTSGKRT